MASCWGDQSSSLAMLVRTFAGNVNCFDHLDDSLFLRILSCIKDAKCLFRLAAVSRRFAKVVVLVPELHFDSLLEIEKGEDDEAIEENIVRARSAEFILTRVVAKVQSLRVLRATYIYNFHEATFLSWAICLKNSLRVLTLSYAFYAKHLLETDEDDGTVFWFTARHIQHILMLHNLHTLSFEGDFRMTFGLEEEFPEAYSDRKQQLGVPKGSFAKALAPIATTEGIAIQPHQNLRQINIEAFVITDNVPQVFLRLCPHMEEFVLASSNNPDVTELSLDLESTALRKLDLTGVKSVSIKAANLQELVLCDVGAVNLTSSVRLNVLTITSSRGEGYENTYILRDLSIGSPLSVSKLVVDNCLPFEPIQAVLRASTSLKQFILRLGSSDWRQYPSDNYHIFPKDGCPVREIFLWASTLSDLHLGPMTIQRIMFTKDIFNGWPTLPALRNLRFTFDFFHPLFTQLIEQFLKYSPRLETVLVTFQLDQEYCDENMPTECMRLRQQFPKVKLEYANVDSSILRIPSSFPFGNSTFHSRKLQYPYMGPLY